MDEIPTIYDFLELFSFLRGDLASYLVILTAFIILATRDWRWSLAALLVQYLIAGFLYVDVLLPHLAFATVLVGVFLCLVLLVTALRVNWGRIPKDTNQEEIEIFTKTGKLRIGGFSLPEDLPFRVVLGLLILIACWAISGPLENQLPFIPDNMMIAILALVGLGLATSSLTSEPFKAGLGLFTFMTGIGLFLATLEQSTMSITLFSVAALVIAVVIAYLTQARHAYYAMLDQRE